MNDCPKCRGTGIVTAVYREVMDASGLFYDQDIQYQLRTMSKACSCRTEFLEWLGEQGYRNVRTFGQRWAANKAMVFTMSISVGEMFDRTTILGRYCYTDPGAAEKALKVWDGTGDPSGRWVAKKGF
jgi:hypothetical protein